MRRDPRGLAPGEGFPSIVDNSDLGLREKPDWGSEDCLTVKSFKKFSTERKSPHWPCDESWKGQELGLTLFQT